jgi:hypothetical protein
MRSGCFSLAEDYRFYITMRKKDRGDVRAFTLWQPGRDTTELLHMGLARCRLAGGAPIAGSEGETYFPGALKSIFNMPTAES